MLRRRGRRRAGAAVALAAVISALCAAVAAPAGAADIREDQRWVLEALNAPEAWKVTKGAGVTVALVDDGVDDRVAELRGKVVSGPSMGSIAEGDGRAPPASTAPRWPRSSRGPGRATAACSGSRPRRGSCRCR
nr:hypothetical protein GCM10020093_059650 [Planobispora longispora]